MKMLILFVVSALTFTACKQQGKQDAAVEQCCDTSAIECVDTTTKKTLNDIRFAGWEYEDWLDNDYIRELRLYINDYLSGEIEDSELDEYREDIKGKFVVANIEPYIMGGAFIQVCFIDCPNKIFASWVYSEVDEEKEIVLGYSCRGLSLQTEDSGFTKERILEIMKEHPEIKAW